MAFSIKRLDGRKLNLSTRFFARQAPVTHPYINGTGQVHADFLHGANVGMDLRPAASSRFADNRLQRHCGSLANLVGQELYREPGGQGPVSSAFVHNSHAPLPESFFQDALSGR